MNKVLFDTNVLIYSIDEDSQYYKKSREMLFDKTIKAYTTSKNIAEFLSVVTRYQKTISIEDAVNIINDFTSFIKILFPDNNSFLTYQKLLLKYKVTGLAIHDLEIASIALSNNISHIATFNLKDFNFMKEIELIK